MMERWRRRWCFKTKFLCHTRRLVFSVTSRLTYRHKAGQRRQGLVKLLEDLESCREYEDIQVMWDMIHSCVSPTVVPENQSKKRYCYWKFCFKPNDET